MNDSKYGRLYPERAITLAREVLKLIAERHNEVFAGRAAQAVENLERLSFPPDEPLFLMRGQDELAPDTVRYYAQRVFEEGAFGGRDSPEHNNASVHLEAHADAMERWQPRKMPD